MALRTSVGCPGGKQVAVGAAGVEQEGLPQDADPVVAAARQRCIDHTKHSRLKPEWPPVRCGRATSTTSR